MVIAGGDLCTQLAHALDHRQDVLAEIHIGDVRNTVGESSGDDGTVCHALAGRYGDRSHALGRCDRRNH